MKKVFFLIVLSLSVTSTFASKKKDVSNVLESKQIKGKIVDQLTGEALAGVALNIEGQKNAFYTDFDGNFMIDDVAPGVYNINVSYVSYKGIELREINTNQSEIKLKVELEPVSSVELQ